MSRVTILGLIVLTWASVAWGDGASLTIKVDQVGFTPSAEKVALVTAAAKSFIVKDSSTGKTVFEGKCSSPVSDPDSGDTVRKADFSQLHAVGKYYLETSDGNRSWPFEIRSDVYARTYYLAARAFYGQRCGMAVDLGPEFPGYSHPACHTNGSFHPSSGKQEPYENHYGWHDAGDYGRYVVNSGISTGTLLWTWEFFGPNLKHVTLNIPESKGVLPDLLAEARWNLEWMFRMQDADGGVWHKQTSEKFADFIAPEKDSLPSEVIGTGHAPFKSTCATADVAAVAAIAARVYRPFDITFADRSLQVARNAWSWAEKNPNVTFRNPPGVVTGEYGDNDCADERLWAAAELWRTTGDTRYQQFFVENYSPYLSKFESQPAENWAQMATMGLWTYALSGRSDANQEALTKVRSAAVAAAKNIAARTLNSPYRISLTSKDYVWGSNGVAASYGMQLLVANAISPDPTFTQAAAENLHYLLGRNTFSLSWVTQVGANPFRHPHHRPSAANKNAEPWPGLLSGGPNANRQDPVLKDLPELPPAKIYRDDQASYASNEIAINWQASLVFLLAAQVHK